MRITIILPSLLPGGAEHQAIDQANKLDSRGCDVQLVVLTDQLSLKNKLSKNIELVVLGNDYMLSLGKKSLLQATKVAKTLKKEILRFNSDIVIANLPISFFLTRLAFRGIKGKALWHYHHSTEYKIHPNNTPVKKILHQLNKMLSKVDAGHIYISKAVQKDIESNFPAENGHIIYNAVQEKVIEQNYAIRQVESYQLIPKNYIVIPGRLHPVKGHEFFLKSSQDILKSNNQRVIFAGYGRLQRNLQKQIDELGLSKLVSITGQVDNEVMLALLQQAKFVTLPSLEEGLGNVAIESLMMGTTVLASNAGGLPEVIQNGKNGYIFEKNNQEAFKSIFAQLVNDIDRYKFSPSLLKNDYKKRFTLDEQIDNLIQVLNH